MAVQTSPCRCHEGQIVADWLGVHATTSSQRTPSRPLLQSHKSKLCTPYLQNKSIVGSRDSPLRSCRSVVRPESGAFNNLRVIYKAVALFAGTVLLRLSYHMFSSGAL